MVRESFEKRFQEIWSLISNGDLKRALELTGDLTTISKDKEGKNSLAELLSRYNRINHAFNLSATVEYKEYALELNRITKGLIDFLPEVESRFLINVRVGEHVNSMPDKNSRLIFNGKNICKSYSGFQIAGVDIELYSSKIIALVGENGSGKSTLLNIIAGKTPVNSGDLDYVDYPDRNWYYIKQSIAYVPQFLPDWIWGLRKTLNYYGIIRGGLSKKEAEDESDYLITRLGLNEYEQHTWANLPGGYKARFELARALICKPRILILDEPLAHLDPIIQNEFLQNLKDACMLESDPIAILISTQHINEVEAVADDILVLENGKPKYYGKRGEIVSRFQSNEIEITCNIDFNQLSIMLEELSSKIMVEKIGPINKISFPIRITVNELLLFLISKNVYIFYYRDITNSSKRLLYS